MPPVPSASGNATSLFFLIITKLQARLKATKRPHRPPNTDDGLNTSYEMISPMTDRVTPKNTMRTIAQVLISTASCNTTAPKIIEKTGTVATAI